MGCHNSLNSLPDAIFGDRGMQPRRDALGLKTLCMPTVCRVGCEVHGTAGQHSDADIAEAQFSDSAMSSTGHIPLGEEDEVQIQKPCLDADEHDLAQDGVIPNGLVHEVEAGPLHAATTGFRSQQEGRSAIGVMNPRMQQPIGAGTASWPHGLMVTSQGKDG